MTGGNIDHATIHDALKAAAARHGETVQEYNARLLSEIQALFNPPKTKEAERQTTKEAA